MDDNVFEEITKKLHHLTQQYQSGALKHYQYVQEIDRTYDNYGFSKKDYITVMNSKMGRVSEPGKTSKSKSKK